MGVGYSASALHRIAYLEPIPGSKPTGEPPPFPLPPGAVWDSRSIQSVSPSISDIVDWRERVAAKYRGQLGEPLSWDESSDFERSEDIAASADMRLRFVAAVLDQQGSDAAARILKGAAAPSVREYEPIFDEAERRSFASKYPQLLLGARYWLPFRRNMILEEPSWRGEVQRFGSLFQLAAEVKDVRDFIAKTDPSATAWINARLDEPPNLLASAWQASDAVSRLGDLAISQRLPLWTTG